MKQFFASGSNMVLFEVIGRRINQPANIKIPLEKKVLFTVWMLSKPETFLAAGDRYNFSQSTAHRTFYEIVDVIAAAVDDHIKWPTPLQLQKSSEMRDNFIFRKRCEMI
ncbi:uncharacterized protein LOC111051664 isoform X2 [Nilaparvata lugens]|uniref:uncharacterized protein LOC111051664 isoform X2 n=1 Tax=Nilaparvata lugens TaxID=108931 RepID=UPI00193E01D0|nr:uncharacterized protein LOC111051664 isoform X2 [Nilaparvata lugens]